MNIRKYQLASRQITQTYIIWMIGLHDFWADKMNFMVSPSKNDYGFLGNLSGFSNNVDTQSPQLIVNLDGALHFNTCMIIQDVNYSFNYSVQYTYIPVDSALISG